MSTIFLPESVSAKRKRVIRELVKGREHATQLKFLLQNPNGSLSAKEMVANVLRSFSVTLSVMTSDSVLCEAAGSGGGGGGDGVVAQNHSEDSSESCRKRVQEATKDRRGSYKRRKSEQTRTIVSQTTDDEHSWRKYGQKEILNTQFPRSYFRCTRKHDQGCKANKQVQRIQENPEKYQITYIGFHTCKDTLKAPEMVTFSKTWDSFHVNPHPDSKVNSNEHQNPLIKQECPSDETPSDVTDDMDHSIWSDLNDFEPSSKASGSANPVYSCSPQGLDMNFGVLSSDFSTEFHFEESNLLYSVS